MKLKELEDKIRDDIKLSDDAKLIGELLIELTKEIKRNGRNFNR